MKLKALLVDDEINILRNLQLVLPWEEYNVDIVGFAKNGVQALEMVHEHNPHIIFCDIRMPIMDGIEFLHNLRSFNEEVEVVMLTGYQEFEYARSVLKYRVLDYILKPIDYDALEKFFIKVVTDIRKEVYQSEQVNKHLHRVKDIAFEKVLLDLINGFYDETHLQEWNNTFRLEEHRYMLMVLEGVKQGEKTDFFDKLCQQMSAFVSAQFSSEVVCYSVQVEDGVWALVLVGKLEELEELEEQQMMEVLQYVYGELLKLGELQPIVGVFESIVGAKKIHQAWKYISKEVSFANVPCMIVREAKPVIASNVQLVWSSVEELLASIKLLDRDSVDEHLEKMVEHIKHLSEQSLQTLKEVTNSIIVSIIKELRRYDAISEEYEKEIWQQLEKTRKVKDILVLVHQIADEAFNEHSNKRPQVSIQVAAEYIEAHLSYDLAAEEVANYLNISLSYFSTIFKQHYGVTFIEYVTAARIERAKAMLRMTKKSISEIAKTVGYNERRYFNKVFLKREGMLPSEYRQQILDRNGVSEYDSSYSTIND